jgi:sulfide dehydrogenase [flavocytochrome c] flavoprotein subunit
LNPRRDFLRQAAGVAALPLLTPLVRAAELLPTTARRVVVVGGGIAGAIAAKTLRLANPTLEVVLVERERSYCALPGANWVIGGSRRVGENRVNYDRLQSAYGIRMLYAEASVLDVAAKRVVFASGTLAYDFAIVAPGISFRTEAIEGYVAGETPALFPHAWTSGEEIVGLKRRLEEMKDGGLVVVALPPPPYRCPQAGYERISQIACYLKQAKPRAKIIVLDASPAIPSLAALFVAGWQREYRNLIEYRGGHAVLKVDAPNGRIVGAGENLRADVVNLVPPQAAGALAHRSGLVDADKQWCPVDHASFESTLAPGVFVIGDACRADGLQKSASAANAQGKACALHIAAVAAARQKPQPPIYPNVIYSLLNASEGAASMIFYRGEGRAPARLDKGGGDSPAWSAQEGIYARAWVGSLLAEMSS